MTDNHVVPRSLLGTARKAAPPNGGAALRQPVKEPPAFRKRKLGFSVIWMVTNKYQCENGALPAPLGQLFQVHGNIFKPDPSGDGGQASVMCITHGVFLFCIRKNPLNGFFSLGVNSFAPLYSHRILLCKGNFCTAPVCFGTFGCPSGR